MNSQEPFYKNKDTLAAETAKYDTLVDCARAHGVAQSTLSKWRHLHGLPRLVGGLKARPNSEPGEVSREELLESEVKDLRSRLAKTRKVDVSNAALVATLEALVPTMAPIYSPVTPKVKDTATEHIFMLDWSDLHASEVVSSEQMNGINEYDWDVMLKRHDAMLHSIVSFKEKRPYPVRRLIINGLGDMLSGNIHPELKETNDRPLMEAALQLGLDMSEWVARLAENFESVYLSGVVGNHPRTTIKQGMKNRYDNYDWMVYQVMKLRLRDTPHVEVVVPRSANTTVQVFDETHLLMHGDGIRSTMPGVPWGGVMRRVAEMTNQYARIGTPIRRFHVGHFHNPNIVEGGRIFMNGSVKGPDEYSLLQFGGGHDASQLLQVYHPRRGLTETCILDLR